MKLFLIASFALSVFAYPCLGFASEQNLLGRYEAIEKNRVHVFHPSGDYFGAKWHFSKWQEYQGVYEFKNNACVLRNLRSENNEVVKPGNLLVYVNNSECCFEVKFISDKVAFNNLYERPIHHTDGICANTVMQKTEE